MIRAEAKAEDHMTAKARPSTMALTSIIPPAKRAAQRATLSGSNAVLIEIRR
jgi:hypothetical protein